MEVKKPMNTYAQKLAEKHASASVKERGLWEAYSLELLTPEQMRAGLRELATQQTKELPSESYL